MASAEDIVGRRFVLGCAQLGGLYQPVTDATAEATLIAAWEGGVRHFDTAPHYGAGLSERRLGAFLAQFPRDAFTLSTKVGRLLVATDQDTEGAYGFFGGERNRRVLDYSGAGVRRSLEQSLDRMGLDRVDIALIHDPDHHLDQAIHQAYPALHELRRQGVIASVGAGMNYSAPLTRFVQETDIDAVMVAGRYTLLDNDAQHELLPACLKRGVTVMAAGVFNSGVLADPKPGASYDYGAVPSHILHRANQIKASCARWGVEIRTAALQFPLRHPAVDRVTVGVRTATQLADNIDRLARPVPEGLWTELDATGSPR